MFFFEKIKSRFRADRFFFSVFFFKWICLKSLRLFFCFHVEIRVPSKPPSFLNAQVTACKKDGAPFSLAGCEADTCRSWPGGDFNQGYVVCHGKQLYKFRGEHAGA